MRGNLQLELPIFTDGELKDAMVEVVHDEKRNRPRVRPVGLPGWVKIRRDIRELGAVYIVERLRPRRGGSWTAAGKIRRVA